MPHLDPNVIIFAALTVIALVLWRLTTPQANVAERQRTMSRGMQAMQQGNFAEAETYLEMALKQLQMEGTAEIPEMISVLTALSQCYERVGKHRESREVFKTVISDWERHLKKGGAMVDIDYAATNSDLGPGTNDVADFYINRVIPLRLSSLPPGHPDISNSYIIAAKLLRKLGRSHEAEQMEAKAKHRG